MTIYKIRMYINKQKRRENVRYEEKEEIIIDNLETAKRKYKACLERMECLRGVKGYSGRVELFIPHIFEDGSIAYWPDDNLIEWEALEEATHETK